MVRAWRAVVLAFLVLAGGAVALAPHGVPGTSAWYPFPVHLDEYAHWAFERDVLAPDAAGAAGAPRGATLLSGAAFSEGIHERGYHVLVAAFKDASGVDWIPLFLFLPAVTNMFLVLAVFVVGERFGAGLWAAAWSLAIPTSVRFLGPGFNVPIAFVLPVAAVALFLLFRAERPRDLIAFGIVAAALWPIHVAGAVVVAVAACAYAAARARETPRLAATVVAAALAPPLVATPFLAGLTQATATPTLPAEVRLALLGGLVPLCAAGVGAAWLVASRSGAERAAGVALSVVMIGLYVVMIERIAGGVDVAMAYDRAGTLVAFGSAILAGVAFMRVARLVRERVRVPALASVAVAALVLGQGVSIADTAREDLDQPYYHVLDPREHEAYSAAAPVLRSMPGVAVVDGASSLPFTLITGMRSLYTQWPESRAEPDNIRLFFRGHANDTFFLLQNGATVVATLGEVQNPDLTQVSPGVFVLREDYVRAMYGP